MRNLKKSCGENRGCLSEFRCSCRKFQHLNAIERMCQQSRFGERSFCWKGGVGDSGSKVVLPPEADVDLVRCRHGVISSAERGVIESDE